MTETFRSLRPRLEAGDFVFCTLEESSYGDYAGCGPIACVAEAEGLTLVLQQQAAEQAGLDYIGLFKCITLDLDSSLHATGLTARIAAALAARAIPANMVAGYFHDHIFVPAEHAAEAVSILSGLSA
jgi:hypothetical protein